MQWEDKVLSKIHQTQARFHKKNRVAKKVAKEYDYSVLPIAQIPYVLRARN